MEAVKVGIREFREKLANYVLETETPIAITRHGDTVGYFLPARRERTQADRERFDEAHRKLQEHMRSAGVTEDDILADFRAMRDVR